MRSLGLLGQIKLLLPSDPLRRSAELVNDHAEKQLSVPVRVVGLTVIYLEMTETVGILGFAQNVSGSRYRNTIKALSQVRALPHVRLLTWLLDEVGEVPRKAIKKLRRAEYQALENIVIAKEKKLDFDRVRLLLYKYLLKKRDAFDRLK